MSFPASSIAAPEWININDISDPGLQQQIRRGISAAAPSPSQLLLEYKPSNIFHPSFAPRYSQPLSSGSSTARTFSTRAPTESSRHLFQSLKRFSPTAQAAVSFETRHELLIGRLADRQGHHIISDSSASPRFFGDWRLAQSVRESDMANINGYDEFSGTAALLIRDGARVNHFLHERSNFKVATLSNGGNVADQLVDRQYRLAPRKGSGTSDGVVMGAGDDVLGVLEDKPQLHGHRQNAISQAGYRIGPTFQLQGFHISLRDDKWLGPPGLPSTEMHVLIQAVDQLYANATRWLILRGYACFTIMYLKSATQVIMSNAIDLYPVNNTSINIVAILVALALPPTQTEFDDPVPDKITLGVLYDNTEEQILSPSEQFPPRLSRPAYDNIYGSDPSSGAPPGQTYSSHLFSVDAPSPSAVILDFRRHISAIESADPTSLKTLTHKAVNDFIRRSMSLSCLHRVSTTLGKDPTGDLSQTSYPPTMTLNTPPTSEEDSPPRPIPNPRFRNALPALELSVDRNKTQSEVGGGLCTPPGSASLPLRLEVIRELSQGASCTTFIALTPEKVRVVIKVAFDVKAMEQELKAYGWLAEVGLQGQVTPRCIGLYEELGVADVERALILVMEDAGSGLDSDYREWLQLNLTERTRFLNILTLLHECGVAHGDLELRHICRQQNTGQIRLIDFGRSSFDHASIIKERNEVQELFATVRIAT